MSESAPQITGKMFLFERPELLNPQDHGDLGLNPLERPFEYCAKARAAPLTVSEIPLAAQHYPVIFSGDKDAVPLAVLGVIDDINLFVDEKGQWDVDAYIPGYVRRYPYAFAAETGGDRLAIVIDVGFAGVSTNAKHPFFENSEPTAQTQNAIEFCKQYEQDRVRTAEFLRVLDRFDLIAGQSAQFTPAGQTDPQTFAQYYGIDESKLNQMTDEEFLDLRKTGALAVIYAQLLSMGRWRNLLARRARRFNLANEEVLKPLQLS
ncbi:MAG: peptidase [Alphaproteobacteria bacterium]|nr:peptidase [Alphaproteobacteria bacterium]